MLRLLDPDLLEVHKTRVADIQHEASSVLAHGVLAGGGLRELELLLHIWYGGLALQADESAEGELRVDRVSAHHLTCDTQQSAHLGR